MMNIFRFCGDMLHLGSIILLILKLQTSRSCIGISCRTQEIYFLVFVCRYVDLIYRFLSLYNYAMKVVFLSTTLYLIYLMRLHPVVSVTYDKRSDNFPYMHYVVAPVFVLSLFTTEEYKTTEIMWTFSIWLESVAILPQLVVLHHLREVENLTSHYVAAMGLYRVLYIVNWIYRYTAERPPYINWVGWIAGVIQTAFYLDFFYYYVLAKWYGHRLILPLTADKLKSDATQK